MPSALDSMHLESQTYKHSTQISIRND